jgi:hypothetical protein
MKYSTCLFFLIFSFLYAAAGFVYSQQEDSIEVYLIDAYAKPEPPHKFILSFFTSDICKSTVVLSDRYFFPVSNEPGDLHKREIDISPLEFNDKIVTFIIITVDTSGNQYKSEVFDFDLPFEPVIESGSDLWQLCLFGAAIFLLPYPNFAIQNGQNYFSLTKEIPIISFRSGSFNYPASYLSLEYTYIFDADSKNYLRAGYKRIYEIPHIEYLIPGVSLYTNFLGNNGVGLEVSAGLFTIEDTFTLYTRYRYNIKPGNSSGNFHEVSIGLYSGFLSFYIK